MMNLDTLWSNNFLWSDAWHMIRGFYNLLGESKLIALSQFGIFEKLIH